jgi:hypothetical protein
MKKLLCAFALSLLLSPFVPEAKSQEVSIDFFYNNINGGSWIEVGNYGYCWQPDVAVNDPTWRPYADGYWAYTDLGWTWISYEDFGWATYHYGRWVRLADMGWVWVPGHRWGPAWVSWRYGGGYCGWAPLPPETEVVYESRALTGQLDVEFDIGPGYYNFVDVRYIGEPVLRSRIIEVNQNVTYINQTVNVTNITYKNKTVYNYGPDLNTVNQFSSRPVQTLKLERQSNVDVASAAKSGSLTKVQGNSLVVAAPLEIKKAGAGKELAPPTVKTRVAQPKFEKGWSVAGDASAQQQLKEKIKTQDLKKIPPPTAGGNVAPAAGASVAPGTSAAPAIAGSPFEKGKGKGKGKQGEPFQAAASASPGGAMTSSATGPEFGKKGKGKNKGAEQFQPGAATSPMTSPAAESATGAPPEYGKRGKGKGREQFGAQATTPAPTTGAEGMGKPEGKHKGIQNVAPSSGGPANPPENFNEPSGKSKKSFEQPPAGTSPAGPPPYGEGRGKHKQIEQPTSGMSPSAQGAAGPQGEPSGEGRGKHKAEGVNVQPGNEPVAPQTGAAKHEGKGKGQAQSPTPGPQ